MLHYRIHICIRDYTAQPCILARGHVGVMYHDQLIRLTRDLQCIGTSQASLEHTLSTSKK